MRSEITNKFVGTWKLVSVEETRPIGEVTYPDGRNPHGLIMYDTLGYVAVQIMMPDRPKFASDDLDKTRR
jgi:hypothetical protein